MVLRAISAAAVRTGLQAVRRALRFSFQLLLRRSGAAAGASATRPHHPAQRRRSCRIPRSRRCRRGRADRIGGKFRGADPDHRDRPQSRAAAPGIVAHRHPARVFIQRNPSGLRSGLAMAASGERRAGRGRADCRHPYDRSRRRRVLFRQRTAGASGRVAAGAAGAVAGQQRRVARIHGRRRLRDADLVAVGRLGARSRRNAGRRPAIGARSTAPGMR